MIFTHCPFCFQPLKAIDITNPRPFSYTFTCKHEDKLQFSICFNASQGFIHYVEVVFYKDNFQFSIYISSRGSSLYVQEMDDDGFIKDPWVDGIDEYFEDLSLPDWDFSSITKIQDKINLLLAFT